MEPAEQPLLAQALAWWGWVDPPVRAALVGAFATVTAATLAARMVIRQIGAQARNAINQNKHAETLKLKLDIYKQILVTCKKASAASLSLATFIRGFESDISLRRAGALTGAPAARFTNYMKLNSEFGAETTELLFITERWGIVDSRMDVFKIAFNAALHDIREVGTRYTTECMTLMPVDNGFVPGTVFPWSLPHDARYEILKAVSHDYSEALMTLDCYITDFQIEMENSLLGELFAARVSKRVPIDPRHVVVSLDRHAEVSAYFESDETSWGRYRKAVEERVRKELADKQKA